MWFLRRLFLPSCLVVAIILASRMGSIAQDSASRPSILDVATLFHGIPLDKQGKVVEIDAAKAMDHYAALAQSALAASREDSPFLKIVMDSQILSAPGVAADASDQGTIAKLDFVIDTFLNEQNPPPDGMPLQLHLLRQLSQQNDPSALPALGDRFEPFVSDYKNRDVPASREDYVACSDPDVPVLR